jgi:hypothetical protein
VKRYTSAPAAPAEDYLLPYFLKDEEKYVELMSAVADILHAFPDVVERRHWERLNEAYHQVIHGSHRYEKVSPGLYSILGGAVQQGIRMYAEHCVWCGVDIREHR